MNSRTRGQEGELENTVSQTLCTHYTQEHSSHGYLHKTKAINIALWMRGDHEAPYTAEDLLAVTSCWMEKNRFLNGVASYNLPFAQANNLPC